MQELLNENFPEVWNKFRPRPPTSRWCKRRESLGRPSREVGRGTQAERQINLKIDDAIINMMLGG